VKYHTNQAKQSNNNTKRTSTTTQERQRLGYQVLEVQKEQHRLKSSNVRRTALLEERQCEKNNAKKKDNTRGTAMSK
jgi:hypothetical protein